MEYTISVSDDRKYIIVKSRGEMTRTAAMQQNVAAHALGQELGINRFLNDVTEARNMETVTDNYQFAYEDMRMQPMIDRSARVALLVSPDDHSHDFIATVASNAGLNVLLFREREQAVRHLTRD